MTTLVERIADVRRRIDEAVAARGPGPAVTLCAVSKRHPVQAIVAAADAGLRDFGENYAQQLRDKRAELGDDPRVRWHAIGPLQRNKVKYVVGCHLVHTVDRAEIVTALQARAASEGLVQRVLVQVNVGGEAQKHGVAPAELPALLDAFADTPAIHCVGLMTIPPEGSPEATRPHFAALRRLLQAQAKVARPHVDLTELSMGMSADFEVAIAEGATIVRVGTAVFGPRPT